jgi:hypothetical protein
MVGHLAVAYLKSISGNVMMTFAVARVAGATDGDRTIPK